MIKWILGLMFIVVVGSLTYLTMPAAQKKTPQVIEQVQPKHKPTVKQKVRKPVKQKRKAPQVQAQCPFQFCFPWETHFFGV